MKFTAKERRWLRIALRRELRRAVFIENGFPRGKGITYNLAARRQAARNSYELRELRKRFREQPTREGRR